MLTGGNNSQTESAEGLAAIKARASAEAIAVAQAWKVPIKPDPNRQTAAGSDPSTSGLRSGA